MEVRTLKCVGGSKDGQTMLVGDGTQYFSVIRPGILPISIRELDATDIVTLDEDCYTRRTWFYGGRTVELFGLEAMSDYEIMKWLVERYKP